MLKLVERGVLHSEIRLSAIMGGHPQQSGGTPAALGKPDVQVLRVGKFAHPKYGEFEITPATLSEMKANFDAKVRGVDLALDYFHESDKLASGWFTELYLAENDTELWAKIDWTPTAQRKLQERELRYFSPDFAFEWKDPESGVAYKNVLFGGGLTNRPFVKDMAAIVAAEERELMDMKELEKKVLKLAEDGEGLAAKHDALQKAHSALQGEHAELKKKLAEYSEGDEGDDGDDKSGSTPDEDADDSDPVKLKAKLAEMQKKCAEMEEEKKKLSEAKQMAEKESKFNLLLTEGKACVAQKAAFMKGDMEEFVKLAEKVNLAGTGTTTTSATGDRDDRVLKLAEEKRKADPKLSVIDALSIANREVQ